MSKKILKRKLDLSLEENVTVPNECTLCNTSSLSNETSNKCIYCPMLIEMVKDLKAEIQYVKSAFHTQKEISLKYKKDRDDYKNQRDELLHKIIPTVEEKVDGDTSKPKYILKLKI